MGEDESGLIYGLEFQCRSLCSVSADTENVKFLVGTQSLKHENQIHQLELDEEMRTLSKSVSSHSAGEVWDLTSSPTDPSIFITRYSDADFQMKAGLWKCPNDDNESSPQDDDSDTTGLKLLCNIDVKNHGNEITKVCWKPNQGSAIMVLVDNKLTLFDFESEKVSDCVGVLEGKGMTKLTNGTWNPHQNCSQFASVNDYTARGWDVRAMKQAAWTIEYPGNQVIRGLDFNPNKQYYLATSGDDAHVRFWDIRHTKSPLLSHNFGHSHWIWCIKYNQFHDQLLLTSSSDFRVVLSCLSSISSEPHGSYDDDNEDNEGNVVLEDGVIKTFDDHEDSVYVAEWSAADPWTFASLSYDGRLVINYVPRDIKFKILNLV